MRFCAPNAALTGLGWLCTICALMLVTLSAAMARELASPEGVWEISMRDSRYEVSLCGEDGRALCGTLVWLAEGAQTEDNLQYLDSMIIDHARPTGPGSWRGRLHLWGHSASGTIVQTDDDTIDLEGCAFFVICRTYTLYRYD